MKNKDVISIAELKLKKSEKNGEKLNISDEANLYAQKFGHEFNLLKQKERKKWEKN